MKKVFVITGVNEPTLNAYENGDRMLRFDVAYLLTQVYGVTVDAMI